VLEVDGVRVLFGADAHTDLLESSVERMAKELGEQRLRVDAVKLSHHGSSSNISERLLQSIDCTHFLVSTDGKRFKHPDAETIELIGKAGRADGRVPTVYFNYRCPTTLPWATPEAQQAAGITSVYRSDDAPTLRVTFEGRAR
jgi:hypothetical protein